MPVCFEPTGCWQCCFIEPMKTELSIIIADDHSLIADGIAAIIQRHTNYTILATVKNGKALLQALTTSQPDLVLLDINMPELNGIDTAQIIKQKYPQVKVVFISTHWDIVVKNAIKKTGADGFIPKLTEGPVFIDTLISIAGGEKIMLTDDLPAKAKKKNDHTAQNKLSARELEVIRYIKKGHTSKEIAELMHLSSYTVDTHRKNICRKLNISSPNALVKFVHENDF